MPSYTSAEILTAALSGAVVLPSVMAFVVSILAKSSAGKALDRHFAFALLYRSLRKAGFSRKKIRKELKKFLLAELSK